MINIRQSDSSKSRKKASQQLFVLIILLFFLVPASVQVPFRVLLLFAFNIYLLGINKRVGRYVFLLLVSLFFLIYKYVVGSFDTSLLMVFLSIGPVYFFDVIAAKIKEVDRKSMLGVIFVSVIGVVLQLCIFRYEGRPNMSYEINQSASYLFLLLLLCDFLKFKKTGVLVFILGALLLSRLFLLSSFVFLFLKYFKKFLPPFIFRISFTKIIILFFIITSIFSFWYAVNMADNMGETSDSSSRLKSVNDGSNLVRFLINMKILEGVYEGDDQLIMNGYGNLTDNTAYIDEYLGQPHNEPVKHIAQYGIIFTLFLLFVSRNYYSKVCRYETAEYIYPVVLYTQFLWVRFTIIPSLEMIFIFYLLTYKLYRGPHDILLYYKY